MQNRTWYRLDDSVANINEFGMPTEDAYSSLTGSMPLRYGTYRFYHNGEFDVSLPAGTISAFSIDPETGLHTATWVVSERQTNFRLIVSNMVTPPTVFALMRPIGEGSTESHPFGAMADWKMIARLGDTSVVRFMDPLETNSNLSVLWENRVRAYEHPRTEHAAGGRGMPWEHIVRICNDTGISPWINIPHMVDDTYIRNVAKVFRFGSNGTDPFESDADREAARTNGETIWEPLDADLQIYIEYSNEVWNGAAAFDQTGWVINQALAEVSSNPLSELLYDGYSGSGTTFSRVMMARYYTRRVVFISNTFREVFGNDDMMTRIRPLILWQQNDANGHGHYRLNFLTEYYGQVNLGNPVARPASYYVWGAGATGYYSPAADSADTSGGWAGVEDIVWDSGDFDPENWKRRLIIDGALARGHGMHYVVYEGGPGLGDPLGTSGDFHPYAYNIVNDPRIANEIHEHQTYFNQYGGDLFTFFTHQGGYSEGNSRWGFNFHLDDPIIPKLAAYLELPSTPKETEIFGRELPADFLAFEFSINGGRTAAALDPSTSTNSLRLDPGSFAVYDIRSTAGGTYQLVMNKRKGDAGTLIEVWVDGRLAGIANGAGGGFTDPIIFDVPANRRISVRLQAIYARAYLYNLYFTETTDVAPTQLFFPADGSTFFPQQTVAAAGAGSNLSWQVSGDVNLTGTGPELTFDTPIAGSSFTIVLTGDNGTVSRTYTIVDLAPEVTTLTLQDAITGDSYNEFLQASNADSPLTWSVISGQLPPGLAFSSAGVLTGSATQAGSYTFVVQVADANGESDTQEYSVVVEDAEGTRLAINDRVVLEAEHGAFGPATDWEFGSDVNASGTGENNYIIETTFSQFGTVPNPDTPSRYATYRFAVAAEGTYRLYARILVTLGGNSFLYRINGGAWRAFNDQGGDDTWNWLTGSAHIVALHEGVNLFEVTSREDGTQLDKFIIQPDGSPAPTGLGPTESPLASLVQNDRTPPLISVPADITTEATGPSGAVVTFATSAEDDADGPVGVLADPASGSIFPIATTTVDLGASDAAGNMAFETFLVTVQDTTPPAIIAPATVTVEATSADGASATFATTATDLVSGLVTVDASPAAGSSFALGVTPVALSATDAAGNTATGSIVVTVQDTTAPSITTPADSVVEATSAAGAVVTFAATATDTVGVTAIHYSAASGSTFVIGTTTVSVTSQDAAGNSSTAAFTVTVQDTTAPVIASVTPSSATIRPPNHKMVPITVTVDASDAVGITSLRIVSVTSNEPDDGAGDGHTTGDIEITGDLSVNLRAERSGNGTGRIYTITVEAKDAAGNVTVQTTMVTVPKSRGPKTAVRRRAAREANGPPLT